jgi:hypothetical protein
MSAPVYTERIKENGEEYSFNLYNDSAGARVVVYSACGESLACESLPEGAEQEMIAAAKDFSENFAMAREDRMNYRGVAC